MDVQGLDKPCSVCKRRSGDHTLDEWAECLGATTLDQEWTSLDNVDEATKRLREKFGLDDDLLVADNVLVESAILDVEVGGGVTTKVPCLRFKFAMAIDGDPQPVTKVLYSADVVGMRNFGALVQKAASSAARVAASAG